MGVIVFLTYLLICVAASSAFINLLYPPKHCQYMVKVTNKSGVYSCSEYPHPIQVKK